MKRAPATEPSHVPLRAALRQCVGERSDRTGEPRDELAWRAVQAWAAWRATGHRTPAWLAPLCEADDPAQRHPEQLGYVYEDCLGWASAPADRRGSHRNVQGSFYTPASVIAGLLGATLQVPIAAALASPDPQRAMAAITVLDPACGSGHFLLAAARMLAHAHARARHQPPDCAAGHLPMVVAAQIRGIDKDPRAAELCRMALRELAAAAVPSDVVATGDALADRGAGAVDWRAAFPAAAAAGGFGVVVGNPPYLSPLQADKAPARALALGIKARTGGAIGGLADTAAAFLAVLPEWLGAGGLGALVVPQSVLAASDAAGMRGRMAETCALVGIWLAGQKVFADADVFVCAPVVAKALAQPPALLRWTGPAWQPAAPVAAAAPLCRASWAPLVSDLLGIPRLPVLGRATVADRAIATADFRDQYYGLQGALVDCAMDDPALADPGQFPRLVTTGMIGLASNQWGQAPARMHKQAWTCPRIDAARLAANRPMAQWLRARQGPKILVAMQTRIIEAWVDETGDCVGSVPVVTVQPANSGDLWPVAAALASPVAWAWAAAQFSGTGLSIHALRMSARQLLQLPAPNWDHPQFRLATAALRAAHGALSDAERGEMIRAFGRCAVQAYGLLEDCQQTVLSAWLAAARL